MTKERSKTNRVRTALVRLTSVLLLMATVMLASPGFAYAAKEPEPEVPIREVHNVGVGDDAYCFFVTHNVVLTPAEVAELTDEELTSTILERAGLYMKKANCKKSSHKEITMKDWTKKNGGFLLVESDIEGIRMAEPVDGQPVKFYMDLIVTTNIEDEEEPLYSTFKRTSPRLLFAVVATEEDAKYGEDICVEDKKPVKKQKAPKMSKPEAPPEEILPEYRTISMVDRSGEPIAETLVDGDPVTLEWIEPKNIGKDEEQSFLDKIPGGAAGLAVMAVAAAGAIIAGAIAVRRKRSDE